jgi:Protein of unknown function (DUF3788)
MESGWNMTPGRPRKRQAAKAPAPRSPSDGELKAALGPSYGVWCELIAEMGREFPPLDEVWRPSKIEFGRVCLLRQGTRTLLYLIPAASGFDVSAVLGERAVALAMASDLPAAVKTMLSGARRYAEGRGIRLKMTSLDQVPVIRKLAVIKTTPK